MEGTISLCQFHDNKENIPPFFSISKTTGNKLSAKMTLKKKTKNTYRKPLNDITNLIVDSLIQSPPATSASNPRLQTPSICRPTAGNSISIDEARCKSLSQEDRNLFCRMNEKQKFMNAIALMKKRDNEYNALRDM
ncbi:hypothetical protein L2E82_10464 [Cichorium intybus]|uniref:Uncharacterized protein n=1 Tax=Cichorium intybus TaxID=13427 RepID=A0ACB9GBN9_CICIN|nr:hypothetical protein L2E82_10464 [Cichorium intybus]